ncbi:hypothetical protein PSP6_690017 [Paraburkholderia tropica]|nr:hypothetical protein PSP6_690017 [Paraburkholderia tropica]
MLHLKARYLSDAHTACEPKHQDQRVTLRITTDGLSYANKVAEFGGGKDFGAFGIHSFLSRNSLSFEVCYERKNAKRSFPVYPAPSRKTSEKAA